MKQRFKSVFFDVANTLAYADLAVTLHPLSKRGVQPTDAQLSNAEITARRAVDALAERDRDALLMKEEGLSYEEIAAALDLSVGSVGTTLSRARRRLMEAYEALQAREA